MRLLILNVVAAGVQSLSAVQIQGSLQSQLSNPKSALLQGTYTPAADTTSSVTTTNDVAQKCDDGVSFRL